MVKNDPLLFLQALQSMAENGCRWRALPEKFGKWYTIYQRFRRWIDLGVFDEIEEELRSQAIDLKGIKKLALDSIYVKVHPVVPPKSHRKVPWEYDEELYKERNIVERNFRNIKEFRRVYARYDKLDETYNAFIAIANIAVGMKN